MNPLQVTLKEGCKSSCQSMRSPQDELQPVYWYLERFAALVAKLPDVGIAIPKELSKKSTDWLVARILERNG